MAGSIKDLLVKRHAELEREAVKRLPFPRWTSPTLELRVKPVPTTLVEEIMERVRKSGRKDATVTVHAAIIAAGTVEVIIGGDRSIGLRDLAAELDLVDADAGDVIRHLTVAEGDLRGLSDAVLKVSGHANGVDVIDEEFAGE